MSATAIHPVESLAGKVKVPGDKSISHRAVIIGGIAEGDTLIDGISSGDDVRRSISAMKALGVAVEERDGILRVEGRGPEGLREPARVINAGNSGTTMRLLAGLLSARPFLSVITGDASLRSRPMMRVVSPMRLMGAVVDGRRDGTRPPLTIRGGDLDPIRYTLPVASAQIKSAVLLAALCTRGRSEISSPAMSRDHTERMLAALGIDLDVDGCRVRLKGPQVPRGGKIIVPGDISSAAFLIVLASLLPGSDLRIERVGLNPTRTGIIDVIREMGGKIGVTGRRELTGEPVGDIRVRACGLQGISIGGDRIPAIIDEIPVLCVAAAFAKGETVIRDAAELRHKECDRISVMVSNLRAIGVCVEEFEDGMRIEGGSKFRAATCGSHGDHRIAMAMAIAGLAGGKGLTIRNAGCMSVSFPGFLDIVASVSRGKNRGR